MYNLFTIWLFYVVAQRAGGAIVVIVALAILVALGAAEPRVLNDNSSQFYSSIIVNFFPFVDWKNVPCTLTIHKWEGCSFAALLGKYAEGTTDCDYKDHCAAEPLVQLTVNNWL